MQETDEEWRVAEGRECATDIADQQNEENDDVDIVQARGVGANKGSNEDHRRARGADHACNQGAERENRGIGDRRSEQIAGQKDPAGDNIKREQQHDEAQIFRQHGVHECARRGGYAK